jgi:hypothetical protein
MSITRFVLLAALTVPVAATAADHKSKPAKEDDPAMKEFVAYLEKNKLTLELSKEGWWALKDEKGVKVHVRVFPADATEAEMKDELMTINLAYRLNAKAKLAMSHAVLKVAGENKSPPAAAELEKLFKEYEPKK